MAKVVTSQGLTEFVQTGKVTHVTDHKPPEVKQEAAKPSETAKAPPEVEGKAQGTAAETSRPETASGASEQTHETEDTSTEGWEDFTDEEKRVLGRKAQEKFNKKHRAMKEAQELAAENERFAEQQFNERRLAEKRAAEAEARAKALEDQIPKKAPEPELKAPSIDDFKDASTGQVDWDKYTDAKADYAAKKAVADYEKKQADEKAAKEQSEAEARMKARFEKMRKAHSDFDQVVESVKGTAADQVPQHVLNYLFESEQGGELHWYLMKNPEETVRISKMKPILALAELGKLEAKLTEPAKPATTAAAEPVSRVERGGAPPPITPLSGEGTTGIVTDPAKMDFKQLREYERNRAREKARH